MTTAVCSNQCASLERATYWAWLKLVQLDRASNSLTLQLSHLYGALLSSQDTESSDEHTQQAAVRLLVPQLLLGV